MDYYLSRKRDVAAAKAFLRKAMSQQRTPTKITLDAYAASHRAVADLQATGELPKRVKVRSSKYLNNLIEQDHRRVKHRLGPMLGLKSFRTAAVVIRGGTGGEDQEGTIQNRQAGRGHGNPAGTLASSPGCVIRKPSNRTIQNAWLPHMSDLHQSHFWFTRRVSWRVTRPSLLAGAGSGHS